MGPNTYTHRHRKASILTAELQAIFDCLESILNLSLLLCLSFLITSDSLSSLCAISNPKSNYPLVTRIHALSLLATSLELMIAFTWVPRHVGIPGNKRIDIVAKAAIEPYSGSVYRMVIYYVDVF